MALMTGAQILIEALAREGAEVIFGYPGGVTLPIYDVLYDHPLRHILVRHEENAAFMAQGFARTTGKVGVCMATSGPGATNLTTGLVDALMDSIPIVAITGQVPQALIGRDAFQEADTFGITRAATKHNYLVKDIDELAQVIHEAFHIAISGRPGPVLVDITKDVLTGKGRFTPVSELRPLRGYELQLDPEATAIEEAAAFVWEGERPLIYAGGGVIAADASDEVVELSEILGCPLVHTVMGHGMMRPDHPNYVSMLGMHGGYAANMAITECDTIIGVGVRFDDRVTGRLDRFAPHARVLHIDVDPAEINKNRRADVGVVGDAKRVLKKLNAKLRETASERADENAKARTAWHKQVFGWKREHPFDYEPSLDEIKPQYLMQRLDHFMGGESIMAVDVGQHQMWAAQWVRFNKPRLWQSSSGLGSMGFGLPAAMGAAVANPDKTVVALCGDGGFMMAQPELATIAANNLPVKVVIMNNGTLGMVRQWQELFYKERYSQVQMSDGFPDIPMLAAAFGLKGTTVRNPADLDDKLREAFEEPGPFVLNIHVTPKECVYPMVPAGGALSDMILGPQKPVMAGD
ncbi:MAG: biosynthetic-type acetolactate synthase large subunit [Acidobacteria bacterium]|nr:biosynthetic-type acetolactate synthase large subunit [Acidobacteriota bacterium]